jgi:type IV secretion system protein TrbL
VRKRFYKSLRHWLPLMAIASLFMPAVFAQVGPPFNTTVPSQIMDQFRSERAQWTANVFIYANALFGILAVIEFAWSAAVMLLEKSDLQAWTSALIRKLMWIGAFYALLLNGRVWIPAIIDSFTQIGQNAAGLGALSPSDIFMQGLSLAGALMDGASTSAFFTNPGTSLALAFAALLIVISYTFIAINFIVTLVESYLVVSVGFIFLGFGGSRWTAPYTERYIGLAVSIGVKIVLLYCLIAAGFDLSIGWLNEAQGISTSARPAMTAFDVMGGALIFMMCCWQIPKLFAAVIGGSPALTGGDLIATTAVLGGAALAAGGAAVSGVSASAGIGGAAAGTGTAASSGGAGSRTTTAVASVGAVGAGPSGGDSVSPPLSSSPGFAANGVAERRQPDPPPTGLHPSISSTLSSIGGEPLEGSGFETERVQRGFARMMATANDQTPAAGPSPSRLVVSGATTGDGEGAAASNLSSPDSSGIVPDVTSVGNAGLPSPQPPPPANRKNPLTRAVDQVSGLRRRLRSLPSDAAPHATPPRIPIDHEE